MSKLRSRCLLALIVLLVNIARAAHESSSGSSGSESSKPVSLGPYEKLTDTMRWLDGLDHCENKKMRLCGHLDYCPGGNESKPISGTVTGEAWAPVSNQNNDWVYIGNDASKVCKLHSTLVGVLPPWGTKNEKQAHKGNLLCCPFDDLLEMMPTLSPSWQEAHDYCGKKPMKRLCTREEYCPEGKGNAPSRGVMGISAWAAAYDEVGQWVSLGAKFPKRLLCHLYKEIDPSKAVPDWSKDTRAIPKRGAIRCCPDAFYNLAENVTYKAAEEFCAKKKERLCNLNEYCPKGAGKPPRGGARIGEAWAPAGDDNNEWVSVGASDPVNSCKKHTTITDRKPDWGTGKGVRGHIQCCPTIWHKLQKKVTYKQADDFCRGRNERLCLVKEYCPDGEGKDPRGGIIAADSGEAWAPVFNRWNEWVFVAKSKSQLCKTHTQIHNKLAPWGETTGFMGTVQCCKKDKAIRDMSKPKAESSASESSQSSSSSASTRSSSSSMSSSSSSHSSSSSSSDSSTSGSSSHSSSTSSGALPRPKGSSKLSQSRKAKQAKVKVVAKRNTKEEEQKIKRTELYIKAYEKLYRHKEEDSKKAGWAQFNDEDELATWRVRTTMDDALDKVREILADAKRKVKEIRSRAIRGDDGEESSDDSGSNGSGGSGSDGDDSRRRSHFAHAAAKVDAHKDWVMVKPGKEPGPMRPFSEPKHPGKFRWVMVTPGKEPPLQGPAKPQMHKEHLSKQWVMVKPVHLTDMFRFRELSDRTRRGWNQQSATAALGASRAAEARED